MTVAVKINWWVGCQSFRLLGRTGSSSESKMIWQQGWHMAAASMTGWSCWSGSTTCSVWLWLSCWSGSRTWRSGTSCERGRLAATGLSPGEAMAVSCEGWGIYQMSAANVTMQFNLCLLLIPNSCHFYNVMLVRLLTPASQITHALNRILIALNMFPHQTCSKSNMFLSHISKS